MFDEFSDDARRVVALAEEAARRFQHTSIGTEHLLIGLLEGPGTTATVLAACGVPARVIRGRMDQVVVRGSGVPPTHLPLSPRATQALETTTEVARDLGCTSAEPPHLLIALLDGQGIAARVLAQLGISAGMVRAVLAGEQVSGPVLLRTEAPAASAVPVAVEAAGLSAATPAPTSIAPAVPSRPSRDSAAPAPVAPAPTVPPVPATVQSAPVAETSPAPVRRAPEPVYAVAEPPVAIAPAPIPMPMPTFAPHAAPARIDAPQAPLATAAAPKAASAKAVAPSPAPEPVPGLGEPRCGFCGRRVSRYVAGRDTCICADCVELSLDALEQPGTKSRRIRPRFAGPADAAAAESAIAAAFDLVFGSDIALEARLDVVQGGPEAAPTLAAALGRLPGRGRGTAHVDHVRFIEEDEAEVQIVIPLHPGRLVTAGHAVLVDGTWMVADETVARLALGAPAVLGQPVA